MEIPTLLENLRTAYLNAALPAYADFPATQALILSNASTATLGVTTHDTKFRGGKTIPAGTDVLVFSAYQVDGMQTTSASCWSEGETYSYAIPCYHVRLTSPIKSRFVS
jgi:hypothetical protein